MIHRPWSSFSDQTLKVFQVPIFCFRFSERLFSFDNNSYSPTTFWFGVFLPRKSVEHFYVVGSVKTWLLKLAFQLCLLLQSVPPALCRSCCWTPRLEFLEKQSSQLKFVRHQKTVLKSPLSFTLKTSWSFTAER